MSDRDWREQHHRLLEIDFYVWDPREDLSVVQNVIVLTYLPTLALLCEVRSV